MFYGMKQPQTARGCPVGLHPAESEPSSCFFLGGAGWDGMAARRRGAGAAEENQKGSAQLYGRLWSGNGARSLVKMRKGHSSGKISPLPMSATAPLVAATLSGRCPPARGPGTELSCQSCRAPQQVTLLFDAVFTETTTLRATWVLRWCMGDENHRKLWIFQ